MMSWKLTTMVTMTCIDRFGPRRPRYLLNGCYYSALSPLMRMIPKGQIQVYICEEDINGRQDQFYTDLTNYFGLEDWPLAISHSNRSPEVDVPEGVIEKLVSLYTIDGRYLRDLPGRNIAS